MTLGGSSGSWAAAASATRSNVQYNPAGDTRQRVRTSSLEIGFLGNINIRKVLKLSHYESDFYLFLHDCHNLQLYLYLTMIAYFSIQF